MERPRGCATEATKTTIDDLWSTHGDALSEFATAVSENAIDSYNGGFAKGLVYVSAGIVGCVIGSVITNKVYDWRKSKKENKK